VVHAPNAAVRLLALVMATALSAAPAAQGEDVATRLLDDSAAEVRQYWTPERMANAIPARGLSGAASPRVAPRRGSFHSRVRKVRRFPKRTHGKVFFTMNGTDFVCSGTVVDAPSRSLVWTAGHCVYEPGLLGAGFADNWLFVPAFGPGGKKPFGEWPATQLATTEQWQDAGPLLGFDFDPTFDLGAATVARSGEKRIQRVVGARRIAFNRSRDRRYHAFGYPARQPPPGFTGSRMFRCDSNYAGGDSSVGPPQPIRIHCDMTGGASGGGWVTKGGKVVSVTSYGYNNQPNSLYGPYMGDVARKLYKEAG